MEAHAAPPPGLRARLPPVHLRMAGDERLAQLAGGGSDAAFDVLFQRFHQPLYRYCRSLLGNDHDAQDALQTTFTQALVALREDRRNAPLRPWLYRIAHNESISLLRRRRPAQELPAEAVSAAERSPHEVMEERVRLATLVADLGDLPERQRGALVMRELSGLPHEEIAQAFGISVGAAKQTVLEARRTLQEFAEGRAMACDEIQRIVSDGDRRALRGRRVRAHLRDCAACGAFAAAIPARQAELRALSPALPVATAAGLLARLTGVGSSPGGGSAGVAAGATGKAIGLVASAKTVATGAAVVAVAAVGAGEIRHLVTPPVPPARTTAPATPAAAHASPAPSRLQPAATRADARLRATPGAHAATHARATATGHAAGRPQRSHGRGAAHRHHGNGAAAAQTWTPAILASPGKSGTRGQGAAHRAVAATGPHGASAGSHGASAAAPGHTGHAGQAAAAPRGVSRIARSTRSHARSTRSHARSSRARTRSTRTHTSHGKSASAASIGHSVAVSAANGPAAHGNVARGNSAPGVATLTTPGQSGN